MINKNKILIVFVFMFPALCTSAQTENWPLGTRAASMGNAYVAESDLWSVSHNQAGLGFYPHFAIGFHHENKFDSKAYNLHAVALSIPVKSGTLGFSYSYFGADVYNENKFGIGFGKQFGNGFAAGIQMNYHYHYLEGEFENRQALSFEAGIQYRPGDKFSLGAHLTNPTRSTLGAYHQDTIPSYFNMGISYYPIDNFRLNLQFNKGIDRSYRIQTGLEYMVMENLFLRLGYLTHPNNLTFGIGYQLNKISADIGFTNHQILGFTPHFSFQAKLR